MQMAPVRASGQIRLLAVAGQRIVHVFHDNADPLTCEHSYLSLRAEELTGAEEENNDAGACRTIEVVVQQLDGEGSDADGEPFLLTVASGDTSVVLRRKIARRLCSTPDRVSLSIAMQAGRVIHPLEDDSYTLTMTEMLYGDYLLARVVDGDALRGMTSELPGEVAGPRGQVAGGLSARRRRNVEAANAAALAELEPALATTLPPVIGAIAPTRASLPPDEDVISVMESPRQVVARLLAPGVHSPDALGSVLAAAGRRLEVGEAAEQATEGQREEYVDALRLVVALEQLLVAEKDKEEASHVIQQLESHIHKQNILIEELRAKIDGNSTHQRADVEEILDDLMARDIAGRSLVWLQRCEGAARRFVDKLNTAAAAIRRAVPDGFRCPITQACPALHEMSEGKHQGLRFLLLYQHLLLPRSSSSSSSSTQKAHRKCISMLLSSCACLSTCKNGLWMEFIMMNGCVREGDAAMGPAQKGEGARIMRSACVWQDVMADPVMVAESGHTCEHRLQSLSPFDLPRIVVVRYPHVRPHPLPTLLLLPLAPLSLRRADSNHEVVNGQ